MKKIVFTALAIFSVFTFFSCQQEEIPTPVQSIKFNITVDNLDPSTKAVKTGWYVGDKVNIWFDANFQQTPDLVMTYDGSGWVADGEIRSGFTPAASGTMKVVYDGHNDFSKFGTSSSSTYTWFMFPTGTIGSVTNNVFDHHLVAYSYPDEYTYTEGTVTAHISNWKLLTDFQVVVTGLPSGKFAMKTNAPLTVPRGLMVKADNVVLAGNDPSYYALGQSNEDGLAFYLGKSTAFPDGLTSNFKVTLIDAAGRTYEYKKNPSVVYTASGTYQAVKLAFNKFKGETNDHMINGHEFVDMGDAGKWATTNVGATNPEDYGDYFAWGETAPYYKKIAADGTITWREGKEAGYAWASYFDAQDGNSSTMITYNKTAGKLVLDAENDAAAVNWGSGWRMPTAEEWTKLFEQGTGQWTTINGIKGYKVTAANGNSIFLPAAGIFAYDSDPLNPAQVGNRGYYWSSSIYVYTNGQIDEKWARRIWIMNSNHFDAITMRIAGQSVRPVVAD